MRSVIFICSLFLAVFLTSSTLTFAHPAPSTSVKGMPAVPYAQEIRTVANRQYIDPLLFAALVSQESAFDPHVKSKAGAVGLTQLIPETARLLGLRVELKAYIDERENPVLNLKAGVDYYSQQYRRFGSHRLALAAYNAGPEAVQRYRGIPPYPETQAYVKRVVAQYRLYQKQKALGTKTGASSKRAAP
jgi:soluble lytic murein transglycosylase-like protein